MSDQVWLLKLTHYPCICYELIDSSYLEKADSDFLRQTETHTEVNNPSKENLPTNRQGQHKDKGNNDKQERTKKKNQTKYSLQTKKTFLVNKIQTCINFQKFYVLLDQNKS